MVSLEVGGARVELGGWRSVGYLLHAYEFGPLVCDDSVLDCLQAVMGREPFPLPALPPPGCADASESYYEEAQPYGEPFNGTDPEVSLVYS